MAKRKQENFMHNANFTFTGLEIFNLDTDCEETGFKYVDHVVVKYAGLIPVMYEAGPYPMMIGQARLTRKGNLILATASLASLMDDLTKAHQTMKRLVLSARVRVSDVVGDAVSELSIDRLILAPPDGADDFEPLGDRLMMIPHKQDMN